MATSSGEESGAKGSRRRTPMRRAVGVLFWLWAIVSLAVASALMMGHTYALPRPSSQSMALRGALERDRSTSDRGRWLVHHFMYSRCRCSQRIVDSLVRRGAMPRIRERVVLVGAHPNYEAALYAAGFALDVVTPEQLKARYRIEAAPLLVVSDPVGAVRYAGGYTERKQGQDVRDVAIVRALMQGDRAAELPLFGCAVSRSLQIMLDPLGLKTSSRNEDW